MRRCGLASGALKAPGRPVASSDERVAARIPRDADALVAVHRVKPALAKGRQAQRTPRGQRQRRGAELELGALVRRHLDGGVHDKGSLRREGDHILQRAALHIDDLHRAPP